MEYNKITNLLGKLDKNEIPKFTTIKWIELFDQSNGTDNKSKDIRFKTNQLRNDLCDFNDVYIVVTGKIIATYPGNDDNVYRKVSLKNSASFFNCTLKINSQLIEDAEDLDIVMPMYNLLYYSENFRKTGSFWNYYPDIPKSGHDNNTNVRQRIIYPVKNSESFNYKTKLIGNVPGVADPADGDDIERELEDIKIVVPLKNISNFMFNLGFLLINSETELILKWTEDCVLTEKAIRKELPAGHDPAAEPAVNAVNRPKDLKFSVTDCKLYVPVVTLQAEYQNQLYKDLKTGISIDFTWIKYRSQMINQTGTINLNFLIDPTFSNVNRLFVLAFPNEEDTRSFSKYYTPTVEIKDYNVIIDGERFYQISIKNKEETYKAIIELIRNDLLRTGNEFNFDYFSDHFKLIAIDLSKQESAN